MTSIKSTIRIGLFIGAAFSLFLFSSCGDAPSGLQETEDKLLFLCGGGIRGPIDGTDRADEAGVVQRFKNHYPEISLETNFGASNLLLGQLKLTNTGDLFLPGDDFYIEEAKKEGFIYETRTVAMFVPVLMVARGNPHGIETVADLANPDLRLAVADRRAAAIGRITPEIFEKNGIDMDELDNIEFTGVTAPEIAQAVEMGHVDATIVWRPVAKQYRGRSETVDIEPDKNIKSPLVIAILETSENKQTALKFADFLTGSEGKKVFEKYHFDVHQPD